jgi:hypothetical protein
MGPVRAGLVNEPQAWIEKSLAEKPGIFGLLSHLHEDLIDRPCFLQRHRILERFPIEGN